MYKKEITKAFRLESSSSGNAAYIRLPGHPGSVPNCVARSVEIDFPSGLNSAYDVIFDYDKEGELIVIEFIM